MVKSEPDAQARIIAFLQSGDAFEQKGRLERIDTHGAIVFLAGDTAWKLKKSVRFPYLDFSTPDKRRLSLEAELRLNRRTAPTLYRAVHPINRTANGGFTLGGAGEPVDWLLEMRRFPADALLERQLELQQLSPVLLMRLADRIAAFHIDAAAHHIADGADRLSGIIDGNVTCMAAVDPILPKDQAEAVAVRQREHLNAVRPILDQRGCSGQIRHGHGDLHLANIALVDGEPTLFDCLEFDEALATTDVLYDLAFLLMDFWHRGYVDEANIVFNRYCDVAPAQENGLCLLPLFLSVRATIRAHVTALRSLQAGGDADLAKQARAYLDLAQRVLTPMQPGLVAIGGLSGTGKTSVARLVGGHVGRPPGARILRSDVIRKRLAGVAPETRLASESYGKDSGARVYRELATLAGMAISQGQAVLVDAVFADMDMRRLVALVAQNINVSFAGFWLALDDGTRIARVRSRGIDASDVDVVVAQAQTNESPGGASGWRTIDATMAIHGCATEILHRLDQ